MYVRGYYNRCPDCGTSWSDRLSQQKVIRIGKETFVCKCPKEWPTGCTEWAHLGEAEKKSYFFSTAEIGVLGICTVLPAIFGFFVGDHGWHSAVYAAVWGAIVGLVFGLFLWSIKCVLVGLSLRRVSRPAGTLSRGGWPW